MRARQALGRLNLPSGWGFILIVIVAVLMLCVVLATWSWWRPLYPFTSQQEYELFIKRLVESVLNQDEAWFIQVSNEQVYASLSLLRDKMTGEYEIEPYDAYFDEYCYHIHWRNGFVLSVTIFNNRPDDARTVEDKLQGLALQGAKVISDVE